MRAGSTTSAFTKRRDRRRERGGSVTEAVVITPCFIIVVFMSIQFMIISFRAVTLQWITTVVMRDIALWVVDHPSNSEPIKSRDSAQVYQASRTRANTLAQSIGIKLDQGGSPPAFCLRTVPTQGSDCINSWTPGTTLQLQLRYNIPLFFSKLLFVNIPTQTVTGTATAVTENLEQNN